MPSSMGSFRVGSSFGIISPDTNVVHPFDGVSPADVFGACETDSTTNDHHASMFDVCEDEKHSPSTLQNDAIWNDITEGQTSLRPNDVQPPSSAALPRLPRLARSFSMPVDAHLGHLCPPQRPLLDSPSPYDEMSTELAESVQGMIQTLLHLSPPHILDPVKEQLSACTVQLPTPSVAALLTTMKNLNFLSSAIYTFGIEGSARLASHKGLEMKNGDSLPSPRVSDNFDIGEVVQSVGDVLGGIAAQAQIDLAIFHGDVGMRHINVMGDEQSTLFILTHVSIKLDLRMAPRPMADTLL
jgi:osomolarity two-component system response regulator SSK1